MRNYLQHGRRHAPTGSDPIPGLSSSAPEVADLFFFGHTLTITGSGAAPTHCAWYEFDTSNTSVFGTTTGSGTTASNASGDTGLLLMAAGTYISFAKAQWGSSTPDCVSFVNVARGNDLLDSGSFTAIEALPTNALASIGGIWGSSFNVMTVGAGNTGLLNLNFQNFDSSSHTVTNAALSCIYLPTADLTSVF